MTFSGLIIYGLATWRLAVLLSDDSGPYRFIAKFRSKLKHEAKTNKAVAKSDVAKGVECIRCNSIWFGTVIAAYVFAIPRLPYWMTVVGDGLITLLALSAIAILIERVLPPT